mmetsp:Transcript_23223/g.58872  ORF Transcript_23223/g.58872 Transcript_23223/m.58872 type:complete len:89 (+) Transcript_23223:758-1024(+)
MSTLCYLPCCLFMYTFQLSSSPLPLPLSRTHACVAMYAHAVQYLYPLHICSSVTCQTHMGSFFAFVIVHPYFHSLMHGMYTHTHMPWH